MHHTSSLGVEVGLVEGESVGFDEVGLAVGSSVTVTMAGTVGLFVKGDLDVGLESESLEGSMVFATEDGVGVLSSRHLFRSHPSSWQTRSLSSVDDEGNFEI